MCLDVLELDRRKLAEGKHMGFEWVVVHNDIGYRCGYLRVEPGHPWYETRGDARNPYASNDTIDLAVHGGVTFGKHGKACDTHGPEAEFWLGWDYAHGGDGRDPSLPNGVIDRMRYAQSFSVLGGIGINKDMADPSGRGEHVWSQEEVEAQCRSACEQAAAIAAIGTVPS